MTYDIVILGGGITGLAAALKASESGLRTLVIEKDSETGGIWRSVQHDGFTFDLGVHGLYAAKPANEEVVAFIRGLAQNRFVLTEKKTKILFKGRLLNYPLVASEFFTAYGMEGFLWATTLLFARAKLLIAGNRGMRSFRDYVVGNFGSLLYRIYFEPYVKKVWGVDPALLSLEALARRVRRIRVREFIWTWIKKRFHPGGSEAYEGLQPARFLYPREGAGHIVEAIRERAAGHGAEFLLRAQAETVSGGPDGYWLTVRAPEGTRQVRARHVISTIPLPELLQLLHPEAPADIEALRRGLRYRGMRMLCLLLDMERVFDAQWIYFQGNEFAFSRINEFKNLSEAFAPRGQTSLAVEFNCDPGEPLWSLEDGPLTERTLAELSRCPLPHADMAGKLLGSFSVPVEHAYPIMRTETQGILDEAKRRLARFPNLYSIGRQGDFGYLNGDECVAMAFKTVEGIKGKEDRRTRGLEDRQEDIERRA
ncbi:MAG: FAD-dependent oxidoreductase [Lentisphaerae bacterium]|nr:FAD-dependent oxidoreductase [Lentisphaerota bacterium]